MSDAQPSTGESPRQGPDREPEVAAPPPPQPDIPWLATKRFWLIALGVFLTISIGLFLQMFRVAQSDSLVAVVALSGPADPVPSEKTRYGVLVRDPRAPPFRMRACGLASPGTASASSGAARPATTEAPPSTSRFPTPSSDPSQSPPSPTS